MHIVNIDMVELIEICINCSQKGKELIPMQNNIPIDNGQQTVLDSRGHLFIIKTIKILEHGFKHLIIVDLPQRILSNQGDLERQRCHFQILFLILLHIISLLIKLIDQHTELRNISLNES